jgi:Nuclease-related domain
LQTKIAMMPLPLLFFLTLIISALVIFLKWKLPYLIGRSGEIFVSRKLNGLDPARYKVLNDIMLPSLGNTDTTQIDHIVVSNHGIFSIETKNYKGWIFGNAHQKQWTQVIYRYKKRFYNPIYQNYSHIKAIENLVKPLFPNVTIFGFVAFPSADKLQISGTDTVGTAGEVVEKIKNVNLQSLTDEEVGKIVELLLSVNITDDKLRKQHNDDIHILTDSLMQEAKSLTKI